MPAIDPNVLECVFYLYPTLEAAQAGESTGGTGFFVGVQLAFTKPWQQIYAVTNWHCIVESGPEIVLRINKSNGQLDYITTRKMDWTTHENCCDVAVLPIELTPEHKYNFISSHLFFLTPEIISHCAIGPGDDVFMVGRFIGHDGKQSNLPTARFGNISRMNGDPIEHRYAIKQESFLVDIRSISGYSGSPVFVYINPTLARPPRFLTPASHPYRQGLHGPWLMGIDWCHLGTLRPVLERGGGGELQQAQPRQYVELNSGIAGVIPAWKIQEVLDLPELAMKRREVDERISRERFKWQLSPWTDPE